MRLSLLFAGNVFCSSLRQVIPSKAVKIYYCLLCMESENDKDSHAACLFNNEENLKNCNRIAWCN